MGQIFNAVAYDTESKECWAMDADKFHANCYSYSGAVAGIHYLLRQKAYRVMWGGDYMVIDDNMGRATSEEDLMGLSVYLDFDDFERNNNNLAEKPYFEKVKRMDQYSKLWNRMKVYDDAVEYFDMENSETVDYTGYLVNHTQKYAVDLTSYYTKSVSRYRTDDINFVIDPVPVLTETGGGIEMALFDGLTVETTENLAGSWCGDLLQIVDELPEDYKIIDCCFAEAFKRARYCYSVFGVDEENFIKNDSQNNRLIGCRLNLFGKRGKKSCFEVIIDDKRIVFKATVLEETV